MNALAVAFRPEMAPVMVLIVLLAIHAFKTYRAVPRTIEARRAALGAAEPDSRAGWVYFAAGSEGPIKIGCTHRKPCQERLPELKTMSPIPLRIIYKQPTPDRFGDEARIHEELAAYRQHGEWFDRDATLYYIDHLKGLV